MNFCLVSPQAPHPPGEERAADRTAGPAAAARDRAPERAVREDLQRPHLAVQPHPDADLQHPVQLGRERADRRAALVRQVALRRVRHPQALRQQAARGRWQVVNSFD